MNSTPNSTPTAPPQALSKEDRKTIAATVRLSLNTYLWAHEDDPVEELRNNPLVSEIRALVHRHGLQHEIESFGAGESYHTKLLSLIRPLLS